MTSDATLTFARLVPLPENRLALAAIRGLREGGVSPLFLHGPPGTGKTHLIHARVNEAARTAQIVSASDLVSGGRKPPVDDICGAADDPTATGGLRPPLTETDLLIIEDLQHLRPWAVEAVVQLFDRRHARRQATVFTATLGPGELSFPGRLTSRLASGLVVGIPPYSPASRLALLDDLARRRGLVLGREVLAWLAEHLGSARQLDGALNQLEALARLRAAPLDVTTVAGHFREQAEASRPTVERIARQVGGHFQVDPRQLRSRRRHHQALLPRQVGMYLARELTGLSLEEIGSYFGGRDHSTVLHACRKVAHALETDAVLSGAVRRLHADLE